MNILELAILKKMVGGGSGTDNYNDLSNLPQINSETLAGNKTAENLGLQDALTFDSAPTEDSTNPVESGGVYNALAGKQDNLTFDDDPTENSTNPVKSGGVYSALAGKQDNLTFDGVYNASTNKAATESTVTNAIAGLDVSAFSVDADETISSISETDGKVSVTKQDIAIASNQVVAMTGYTKPSSAPATPAIQQGDTANLAIGKLEYKADVNQSNILSVEDMVCATEFSSSTAYAVGDMVTYEHKLYKFINAHRGAWSASDVQNYDLTYLQAEDRAALAEEIDAGAKNLLETLASVTLTAGSSPVTYTKDSNDYISASPTDTDLRTITYSYSQYKVHLKPGTYVLMVQVKTATSSSTTKPYASVLVLNSSSTSIASISATALQSTGVKSAEFTITTEADYGIYTKLFDGSWRIMVCTKAAFGVSKKFVPFGNDPFYQVPINHNMIYRGQNLGATLTDAQHTALSSGNFTDLYLGDYWTKTVTIPAGTYTGGDGEEVTVPAQTNITLKAVIADFDTFYAGYASGYAAINTHHAAVIVTGFSNVVWNKTNSTAGGYVASLIHKWLVGSALPQIETWFGSAKILSHQKLLTNAITGDAASGWAWSSQKISLLSENQMYGSKVWGNSKATNGGYEPGEAFKHLNVFNHIDANLLFGNKNIWLRDIASAVWAAFLRSSGNACNTEASITGIAPAALILLS